MKTFLSIVLMVISFSSMAVPIYTEPAKHDSGDYPTYISFNTERMYGKIGGKDSYDLYAFHWDGGQLVVNTFGETDFDSVLWLYNSSGLVYNMNDNAYPSTEYSQMINHLPSGIYHIKITSNDLLTVPTDYQINRNVSHHGIVSGITPVQEIPVIITTPEISRVPEPSVIALLGIGFIGMVSFVRRK